MGDPISYEEARYIDLAERDVELNLDALKWPDPGSIPPKWTRTRGRPQLQRTIAANNDDPMAGPLRETLLRFPSAPLHGWQRLHEHHVKLKHSENFHTYRLLSHPDRSEPVKRLFLMHNGLNELDSMGLYYQLASHLVRSDRGTICVVRPFPGHLSRFPFQTFGETPLDRYLWDGSHLFRQFLRYMIETQWFLSAIVRRSSYRSLAGANLLAEHEDMIRSRLEPAILADKIASAWGSLYDASANARKQMLKTQFDATTQERVLGTGRFRDAITSLRAVLQLDSYPRLNGELCEDDGEPSVHVVGYSLGGFTAQSVFMSWPFLIASCSTVLSGGALRELSPTAFAHPEEWQTVLHSLRYELDDAMMDGRNGREARTAAGMEQDLFLYLKRTFYEVFQQEYRGSFQSRLAAFLQRMLFVVGGNDPIVQTRSVLDSGPPGGINMLTIGGLGHFLDVKDRDDEETQQRTFWLPEIARLIHRFSGGAEIKQEEERPYTWVNEEMEFVARPPDGDGDDYQIRRLSAPERLAISQDGALPAQLFERCLDDLMARQDDNKTAGGLLFVLRNELPTMLLDDLSIYEHAAMLNHDDVSIARYVRGVRGRRDILIRRPDRIALIIPWNVRRIMASMDTHKGYPSQAEAPKGEMPKRKEREAIAESLDPWSVCFGTSEEFVANWWRESVRIFDGRKPPPDTPLMNSARSALHHPDLYEVPSLPDCWVWMSREFLIAGKDKLTITSGLEQLQTVIPANLKSQSAIDERLQNDDLRIITVSRARYNPRFRGRVVVDPKAAKSLLLHVALCASASVPFKQDLLEAASA
jgi:hypothetical protein